MLCTFVCVNERAGSRNDLDACLSQLLSREGIEHMDRFADLHRVRSDDQLLSANFRYTLVRIRTHRILLLVYREVEVNGTVTTRNERYGIERNVGSGDILLAMPFVFFTLCYRVVNMRLEFRINGEDTEFNDILASELVLYITYLIFHTKTCIELEVHAVNKHADMFAFTEYYRILEGLHSNHIEFERQDRIRQTASVRCRDVLLIGVHTTCFIVLRKNIEGIAVLSAYIVATCTNSVLVEFRYAVVDYDVTEVQVVVRIRYSGLTVERYAYRLTYILTQVEVEGLRLLRNIVVNIARAGVVPFSHLGPVSTIVGRNEHCEAIIRTGVAAICIV